MSKNKVTRHRGPAPSDLDLRANLQHAIGRDVEEGGGPCRVARQEREEWAAPAPDPTASLTTRTMGLIIVVNVKSNILGRIRDFPAISSRTI